VTQTVKAELRPEATTTNSSSFWYVYGAVPASFMSDHSPPGLDDGAIAIERAEAGDVAALVSRLDHPDYEPATLEERSGDVEWLSPRATAHDRVLTWASDHGAVVPFPMFSLFSGERAVQTMLRDRGEQLAATLRRIGGAREYALRVYRVDAELLAAIPTLSPRLRELAAAAASASPGQRYLLERKLDGEKRSEMRVVTQRIVDDIVARLSPHARAVARSPIPRVSDRDAGRGVMVLNTAFLVDADTLTAFQRMLTTIVDEHSKRGFRFDFTGPWPPYHFVNESNDGR
jgi:hypothetical protein